MIQNNINNLLKELKNTNLIPLKYAKLIELSKYNVYDNLDFKIQTNLLPDCAAKTWLFKNIYNANEFNTAYSESRLINSLIIIIKNKEQEYHDIGELIEDYGVNFFYSNIRVKSLQKMFLHLTT
jgi:sulfur transfer protein SufE